MVLASSTSNRSCNMPDPRLLFVRYCPGSCGNFLISVLQQSAMIAHWNPILEQTRGADDWRLAYLEWFKSKFQCNLHDHLKSEPHHPYRLDFVSAKHPRGDDISKQDFLSHLVQRDDIHFFNALHQHKLICMRLNKSTVPLWGENCQIVNIVVDKASEKWLHRTRAVKMFGKENNKFIVKENHPDFLRYKFQSLAFANPYEFVMNKRKFIRDFVIGEPTLAVFKSEQKILADSSNKLARDQIMINLSDLFDWTRFHLVCNQIYRRLDLGPMDVELVKESWQHYFNLHIQPILCKKIPIF